MTTIATTRINRDLAENYLDLYQEFANLQLYQKAEQTLHVALEKFNQHPAVLEKLARHYLQLDIPQRALTIANRLVRYHPELKKAYRLRGEILETLGEDRRARKDYEQALTHSVDDEPFLRRLIQLIQNEGELAEALDLIRSYQVVTHDPVFLADLQAALFLQSGENKYAFSALRSALLRDPQNKSLLKDYIRQSNRNGKRTPGDVYFLLQNSIPRLVRLSDSELTDLEVDFYQFHGHADLALGKVNEMLKVAPQDYFWRKRRAFIWLETGDIEESVKELRTLFLENAAEETVLHALENYYMMQGKLDSWKKLVHDALKNQENALPVYHYLRRMGDNRDWLRILTLTPTAFLKQVAARKIEGGELTDITWQKLPPYVLELFVAQLAISQRIPDPQKFWKLIESERSKKGQTPPFEPADVQAAYPVWLFAIHLYLLFRSKTPLNCSFDPQAFQNDQTAFTVATDALSIEIDLGPVLNHDNRRLKSVVKTRDGLRWRWHDALPEPTVKRSGTSFYSAKKFADALKIFTADINAEAPGSISL